MCFCVPHSCSKIPIDRWIVVYTVFASAMISPLRQWLDSYAKTRLKMWHTSKHFIHMQYGLIYFTVASQTATQPCESFLWLHCTCNNISCAHVTVLFSGRCSCNFKSVILKLILWTDVLSASFQIAVRPMPQNFTGDKSTLVPVVDSYCQATGHNPI